MLFITQILPIIFPLTWMLLCYSDIDFYTKYSALTYSIDTVSSLSDP